MESKFILAVCKPCPHSRLVGGQPPNWTGQWCLYKIDNAAPTPGRKLSEVRAAIEAEDLRTLHECPDEPRRIRAAGGA